MANEVAERYAQGLFELAWETGTAETKKEQAEGLLETIRRTPELKAFLQAVKITKEEKTGMADGLKSRKLKRLRL
jgi:F0F1-type ATP synthase delta subunit